MVIGTLDVDHLLKSTLPFAQMVGDIWHKICVAPLALSHHPVFVVSKVRGLEPQGAVLFIRVPRLHHVTHRFLHSGGGVQTGLQIKLVKLECKR